MATAMFNFTRVMRHTPGTGIHIGPPPTYPCTIARLFVLRNFVVAHRRIALHLTHSENGFSKIQWRKSKIMENSFQNYFEVYSVQLHLRTHFTSLNFISEAAL
jgi:hypothetical protein